MYTNIQQNFRFYLAFVLTVLLAVGVRLQAAPLGSKLEATTEVTARAHAGNQVDSVPDAVAVR